MAPDLIDHETRLRMVEKTAAELSWAVDAHDRALPKLIERCDKLEDWRRAERQQEIDRERGLTRREKYVGMVLLVLAPIVSAAVQHLLK